MNPLIGLYLLLTVILAASTFFSPSFYNSLPFLILWGVAGGGLTFVIFKCRMWIKPGRFLLHLSFLLMLAGGLATWSLKKSGYMRLTQGTTVNTFISEDDATIHTLPFPVSLLDFRIDYYPGGEIPMDYRSKIIAGDDTVTVSMNTIHSREGYRFMQSSYDSEGVTILAVSHDPYGIFLSYSGYLLFAVGGLLVLLSPEGRFRRLLRGASLLLLLVVASDFSAAGATVVGISRQTADSLSRQQVIYEGRVVTFNTLSRDILLKLYGKTSYRGLSSEQVVLSFSLYPKEWKDIPLMKIKNRDLQSALGIKGRYASLSDLFDNEGRYRVESLRGKDNSRDIEQLDEKAGILLGLVQGSVILPIPPGEQPLPGWRVELELLYNRIPFTLILFITLFCGAFLKFVGIVAGKSAFGSILRSLGGIFLPVAAVIALLNISLIWILSGRFPLSNTFETLEFVAAVFILLSIAGRWLTPASEGRDTLEGLAMLAAGAVALVAHLVARNPMVTPLMPVLHSPWLSIHVSLVMTAYALLLLTSVNSLAALCGVASPLEMRRRSLLLLYPGVWLLGLGIFTGAIWANVSWGSYWSWDPKETWALVTFLIYSLPLHNHVFNKKERGGNRNFHLYLLLALLSVGMTYFGVNYLDSMHAYQG